MLRRRYRPRGLPVNSLIPNVLTVLALCAGMTSIRFALQERYELAVIAIVVAAILDGLDGRVARLLKGATKFGAEMDSLSDFVCFGVAPALLVFLWSTHELGGFGWMASLAFGTCCALRLARFNTALDDPDRPAWAGKFFTGVAAPAGAGFAMLPLAVSFQVGDAVRVPELMSIWLLVVALLMVSRIPTYSFKGLRVRREQVLPLLVVVGIVAAMLVSYPWFVLSTIGFAYLASIPFSVMRYRRYERSVSAANDSADGGAASQTGSAEQDPKKGEAAE